MPSQQAIYISTDGCTNDEFYCEATMRCLPLEVMCDGVPDCVDDIVVIDELNCKGKFNNYACRRFLALIGSFHKYKFRLKFNNLYFHCFCAPRL